MPHAGAVSGGAAELPGERSTDCGGLETAPLAGCAGAGGSAIEERPSRTPTGFELISGGAVSSFEAQPGLRALLVFFRATPSALAVPGDEAAGAAGVTSEAGAMAPLVAASACAGHAGESNDVPGLGSALSSIVEQLGTRSLWEVEEPGAPAFRNENMEDFAGSSSRGGNGMPAFGPGCMKPKLLELAAGSMKENGEEACGAAAGDRKSKPELELVEGAGSELAGLSALASSSMPANMPGACGRGPARRDAGRLATHAGGQSVLQSERKNGSWI